MELAKMAFGAVKRLYGYYVTRPVQRYNVENRAFRALDKQKVVGRVQKSAPGYPATEQFIRELEQERPEIAEEIKGNPKELIEHLKQVKVSSMGAGESSKARRKAGMPTERWSQPLPEFGLHDPEHIPAGKISIRKTIEMIDVRNQDKTLWTFDKLATAFSMKEKHVVMVLEHFKPFQIYQKPKKENLSWFSRERVEDVVMGHSFENYLDVKEAKEAKELSDRIRDDDDKKSVKPYTNSSSVDSSSKENKG